MMSTDDPQLFEGVDNCIADLLAAPIIRDAQTITWYAAGAKDTWLCITKKSGATYFQTFEARDAYRSSTAMPHGEFRHNMLRSPIANYSGLTEDLSCNHYAINQLAIACLDAWDRKDLPMHAVTLEILSRHVPTVAAAFERAKTIPELQSRLQQDASDFCYAIGETLHAIDAILALADDPRISSALDPWFRVQQLVRVASLIHPANYSEQVSDTLAASQPVLYTLESDETKSFLLVSPLATETMPSFNMWLDAGMRPLLIDYKSSIHFRNSGGPQFLESPGNAWEFPRPYPGTLEGWAHANANMNAINTAPFDSLKTGSMRALLPNETLDAVLTWAKNPNPMSAWSNTDDPEALLGFGQWTLAIWAASAPRSAQLLQSLLPAIDPLGSPGQLDVWRQLVVAVANPAETAVLPRDNVSLDNLV